MLPKFNHVVCPFNINLSAPIDKYALIICAVSGTSLKNSAEKLNSKIMESKGRKRLNKVSSLNISMIRKLIIFEV